MPVQSGAISGWFSEARIESRWRSCSRLTASASSRLISLGRNIQTVFPVKAWMSAAADRARSSSTPADTDGGG